MLFFSKISINVRSIELPVVLVSQVQSFLERLLSPKFGFKRVDSVVLKVTLVALDEAVCLLLEGCFEIEGAPVDGRDGRSAQT